MDRRRFIQHFKKLFKKGWEAGLILCTDSNQRLLRLKSPLGQMFCFCPITAVCYDVTGDFFSATYVYRAAAHIDLPNETTNDLIDAFDARRYSPKIQKLQQTYLKAAGLI